MKPIDTLALSLAAVVAFSARVHAQTYPDKAVRMIVPFPAGGPTDILGRLVGQRLADAIGQPVIIDNRPGGSGTLGAVVVTKAPADGYTLFLGGVASLTIAPLLQQKPQYDPFRDFAPVTLATLSPLMLMVHPSLPAKTVKEFITLAKSKPGELHYATSGPTGTGLVAGELFKLVTGAKLVAVPYRGAPPALTDLAAGHVPSMFGTLLGAMPLVRSGKIRAVAVTGPRRSIALPDVPTFAEAGLPGYDASAWNGFAVAAGTPRPIVSRLSTEIARIIKTPNVLDRLVADGPIAIGSTPEEMAQHMKTESTKYARVIRESNIQPE